MTQSEFWWIAPLLSAATFVLGAMLGWFTKGSDRFFDTKTLASGLAVEVMMLRRELGSYDSNLKIWWEELGGEGDPPRIGIRDTEMRVFAASASKIGHLPPGLVLRLNKFYGWVENVRADSFTDFDDELGRENHVKLCRAITSSHAAYGAELERELWALSEAGYLRWWWLTLFTPRTSHMVAVRELVKDHADQIRRRKAQEADAIHDRPPTSRWPPQT